MFKKNKNIKTDSKIINKTKTGIIIFDKDEDIVNLFVEKASYLEKSDPSYENGYKDGPLEKKIDLKKDKHGLPILDGGGTLSKMITDAASIAVETGTSENFSELIDTVLKGKNRDAMMKEKSDRPVPDPVPLKKRLNRYPSPQDEIDLHGYTAKEAESKTETYLRNCWRNGLFTVQIIVGRGIHSTYGAVLPDVVENLLVRLKREGILLWFEWDRRTKSQSGAIIAYLKQF